MASGNVKSIAGKVGNLVNKISGPSAVAAIGTFVASAAFYQAFQDTAGAELAQNIALGGVGLTVTSLMSAMTGKGTKNPLALVEAFRTKDPLKILKKTGELYAKDPSKANAYIDGKLDSMTPKQREAFSDFVRHESKMSQFRSGAPTKEQTLVAKGKDVFRSVTMGISMPRQRYGSGLDRS